MAARTCLWKAIFGGFGKFEPQNVSHCESKSIHGPLQWASPGKNKNRNKSKKEEALYFTYFARHFTNFGLRVRLVDAINSAKFYRSRLMGLDIVRVEFWPLPLDCDVAVNTVWTVHAVIIQGIHLNASMELSGLDGQVCVIQVISTVKLWLWLAMVIVSYIDARNSPFHRLQWRR